MVADRAAFFYLLKIDWQAICYSLKSIYKLLDDKQVKMPIINLIYDIIYGDKVPEDLLTFLIEKI